MEAESGMRTEDGTDILACADFCEIEFALWQKSGLICESVLKVMLVPQDFAVHDRGHQQVVWLTPPTPGRLLPSEHLRDDRLIPVHHERGLGHPQSRRHPSVEAVS
ncbi:hypothetical protein H920_19679 [Fukomys damarensis]|uniref:Uncharacterized protein n=1 Tax=Fukomys damarensis TaxID=885580 RepID=A0A091CP40_FUKDA|nr:hypothetical protein H920_19679 [Fukomys damarensis]